ncbi:MAG: zinc-binding dehydrogenase, partial [Eudoraea sp.]|uniref:zinc-binding dehydrogenase n=1 Tax=Eudoraea sp. TaxID=1979955 RepID=UPI003C7638FE
EYSEAAFRGIAWEGRYLVVGFASGTIPKMPLNLPLLKTASLVGVFWGDFAMRKPKVNMENTRTLMKWYDEGRIKPHIHKTYELKETTRALEEIMNRKVRGKLVIEV